MENQSALVTVAMLSAFLSKDNKNYLDLITPFVLNLLPNKQGEKIDRSHILKELNSEYGFEDMPAHVLTSILSRVSKGTRGIVLKKNHEFFLRSAFDSSKFKEDRLKMKELTEDIISSLLEYFKSKTSIKIITLEESQKRLIIFLNYYGLSVIRSIDDLKSVTIKTDQNNYHVARFILQEYKNDSHVFHKMLELVKGFLIYKSIYFFSSEQKKSIESKLKRTVFYFDTRLLIYALGYNREEDKLATRELIKLIRDNGGEVKTFNHNKDEVAGILTKYAKDRDSRNSLSLEFFNINCYEETDVLRLRGSIALDLERNYIETIDTPEYGTVSSDDLKDKGYLDLKELKVKFEENLKYNGNIPKDASILNDVESVSAISRLRGKAKPCTIEDCKAIFVTTNSIIIRTLFDLYKDRFSKGEISFAINEVDLTAILWLKSFDKKTEIPCLKLLENAYAACCPSREVMDTFLEKVIQLENEGEISSEVALLMRTQHTIKNDILELTENDKSRISAETVRQVKEKFIKHIRQDDETKITVLEKENSEYKRSKAQAYQKAETEAKDISKEYGDRLILRGKFVFGILIIIFIASSLISCITSHTEFLVASIIATLLGILGFINLLVSKVSLALKFINKKEQKRFDKLYAENIEQLNRLFQ